MALSRQVDVSGPTLTTRGTILIPFQDRSGQHFVVELSRSQTLYLVDDMRRLWEIHDRQVELGRAMLDIDRADSVV